MYASTRSVIHTPAHTRSLTRARTFTHTVALGAVQLSREVHSHPWVLYWTIGIWAIWVVEGRP